MSSLVGNPEYRFSRDIAQISVIFVGEVLAVAENYRHIIEFILERNLTVVRSVGNLLIRMLILNLAPWFISRPELSCVTK